MNAKSWTCCDSCSLSPWLCLQSLGPKLQMSFPEPMLRHSLKVALWVAFPDIFYCKFGLLVLLFRFTILLFYKHYINRKNSCNFAKDFTDFRPTTIQVTLIGAVNISTNFNDMFKWCKISQAHYFVFLHLITSQSMNSRYLVALNGYLRSTCLHKIFQIHLQDK